MKTFKAAKIKETDLEEVKNEYLTFYNDRLNEHGIKVYFDNVSYVNGMSVYISFVKEGSEILQMRHSDHLNGIGFNVVRASFDLKTNGTFLPSDFNCKKIIEILNKYTL